MHEYEIFSKLLHERNLTAYQVYKATGVPQSTLSDWKKGRYRPNAEKLLKIANFLGVTVEYLLTGDEEKRDFVNNNPELTEYLTQLRDREDMRMLFSLAKDADREDVMQAVHLIEELREKGGQQ
jgi:transcriptional regulator with XRE-family HTH domain